MLLFASLAGCEFWSGGDRPAEVLPTPAALRADRRSYDGAPPVIPHPVLGGACMNCHNAVGRVIPGIGIAPPSPHGQTPGLSEESNCRQCHVFAQTERVFVVNTFQGLPQAIRLGARLYEGAPPVMPHSTWMREDCLACHAGPAARPEILCTHPERTNCLQCHAQNLGVDMAPLGMTSPLEAPDATPRVP